MNPEYFGPLAFSAYIDRMCGVLCDLLVWFCGFLSTDIRLHPFVKELVKKCFCDGIKSRHDHFVPEGDLFSTESVTVSSCLSHHRFNDGFVRL